MEKRDENDLEFIISEIPTEVIDDSSEVESIYLGIYHNLSQNSDWEKRSQAMHKVISLIKGGILDYPQFEFYKIVSVCGQCLVESRPVLMKWSAVTLAHFASALGIKYAPCIEVTIPYLFRCVTYSNQHISSLCKTVILRIVECVPNKRTTKSILVETSSKAQQKRYVVAQAMMIMVQKWSLSVINLITKDIRSSVYYLNNDSSSEIRELVKETSQYLEQRLSQGVVNEDTPKARKTPKNENRYGSLKGKGVIKSNFFTPQVQKYKSGSLEPHSMLEGLSIEKYIPPENNDSANSFLKIMQQFIQANYFKPLEGIEFAIPSSIISSMKLLSFSSTIENVLVNMVEKYPNEFSESIGEIIILTKVSLPVLKKYHDVFGFLKIESSILSLEKPDPTLVVKFFSESIVQQLTNVISQDSIQWLTKNISSSSFNTDVLYPFVVSEVIKQAFGSLSICSFIIGDSFDKIDLENLNISASIIAAAVQNEMKNLSEILVSEDENSVEKALYFLNWIIEKGGKMQFVSIIPYLLSIIKDPYSRFAPISFNILIKSSTPSDIIPFISSESSCEAALLVLSNFPKTQINDTTLLIDNLVKFLQNKNISMRRISNEIIVNLLIKDDVMFQQILLKLPPFQQRILYLTHLKVMKQSIEISSQN